MSVYWCYQDGVDREGGDPLSGSEWDCSVRARNYTQGFRTEILVPTVRFMKARNPLFILYVNDMNRALRFYRDTFSLEVVQHTSGWSMLRFGSATIGLHILSPATEETVCSHAGLSFQVDDLDSAIGEVIAAGGSHRITREATDFVPVRMCELRDPEGNGFEMRQHVADGPDLTAG